MLSRFGKYLLPLFILAVLFTLLDAFVSFYNVRTVQKDDDNISRSREFIIELSKTFSYVKDAETGERGFLLTNNSAYLEPYTIAFSHIPQNEKDLINYAKSDSQRLQNVTQINKTINSRLAILKKEVDQIKNGADSSSLIDEENAGKAKMDQLRQEVTNMEMFERNRLNSRIIDQQESIQRILITLTVSSFFNLLLIYIAYQLIKRELETRFELEKRKDEFISLASHELRTPLTSLKLFTEILQKRMRRSRDKESYRFVGKIEDQVLKLTELVKDLLDLSRIQTGKLELNPEMFNLNELIDDTVEALEGTTHKHTFVVKEHLRQDVFGDRYRVYQVLTNLLTNAIKYSPKGGKITVTTKKTGNMAEVAIKDQGVGIAKEHKERIFERLYRIRTKDTESATGLGIGLFIASDIVTRHGGRIWLESTKGKGSIFYFTLPLTKTDIS